MIFQYIVNQLDHILNLKHEIDRLPRFCAIKNICAYPKNKHDILQNMIRLQSYPLIHHSLKCKRRILLIFTNFIINRLNIEYTEY